MNRRSFLATLGLAPAAALAGSDTRTAPVPVSSDEVDPQIRVVIEAKNLLMPAVSTDFPFIYENGEFRVNSRCVSVRNGNKVLNTGIGYVRIT